MSEIEQYDRGQMVNRETDSWTAVMGDVTRLAEYLSHTEFVPAGLRGKDGAKVAAAVLTGRELGLAPMTALASIHVINGKPGISAEMMRALVLQAGHEIVVSEVGTQRVVIKGRREGTTEWTTVSWSDQDAKRAGLQSGNYAKYPRQMLTARATTELCRLIFADVIHGLRSVEELEGLAPDEILVGEVVEPDAPAAPAASGRTVGRKRTPKVQPADEAPEKDQGEKPAEATSQRRRPTVTKRGQQPAMGSGQGSTGAGEASEPGGAAAQGAAAAPDPNEPVEAEIVDEQPEAPVETTDAVEAEVIEDAEPRLTEKQRNLILVRFDEVDIKDRAERLWTCSQIVGRELSSANDMTRSEAGHVIDALVRCQNRGDVEIVVEQAQKDQAQESDQ